MIGMSRRRRTSRLLGVGLTLAVGATLAVLGPTQDSAPSQVSLSAAAAARSTATPTTFRVANFNVLGYSHTAPGGNRKGWAGGLTRMVWATQIIENTDADLVGFQEFEPPQYDKFAELMPSWTLWPTKAEGNNATANSIAWKSSDWTAVVKTTYKAPYFYGIMLPRPLVQLRNNATGQLVWVLNTHNPADTRGNAQQWRDQSERIQAALVNDLRRQQPDVPVIFVGDMNDRERFYCPVTYLTELESASGGTHGDPPDGSCTPATQMKVDWIMGTDDIGFSGYTSLNDALVRKTTDHTYLYADASIPSQAARAANIKHVVVIDVEGLPSRVVGPRRTPTLTRLRDTGASTLNARGAVESRASLPNTVSILTGRSVAKHGVRSTKDTGKTVQGAARQYVSSVFDMAHNLGLTTSLYSGDTRAAMLVRSWNAQHGGLDSVGRNNGRRKFSTALVARKDSTAVSAARTRLATKPSRLTFIQLGDPARVAHETRFGSRQYVAAVKTADRRVSGIMRAINSNAKTRGTTLVIVTSSTSSLPAGSRGYGVPLIVRGPSVPHASLYTLNPRYADPGTRSTTYAGTQPIRTGMIANLVTSSLLLPVIPRSTFNSRQDLSVFVDPAAAANRR